MYDTDSRRSSDLIVSPYKSYSPAHMEEIKRFRAGASTPSQYLKGELRLLEERQISLTLPIAIVPGEEGLGTWEEILERGPPSINPSTRNSMDTVHTIHEEEQSPQTVGPPIAHAPTDSIGTVDSGPRSDVALPYPGYAVSEAGSGVSMVD